MVNENGCYRGLFKDIIMPGNFLERLNNINNNKNNNTELYDSIFPGSCCRANFHGVILLMYAIQETKREGTFQTENWHSIC
jgi:hypothetical protein